PLLRAAVHAHPCARGDGRAHLLADAALRNRRRQGDERPSRGGEGPSGRPLDNPARNIWITETGLATALNVSYMATQLSLFSLVIGVALLLAGIGFIILASFGTLRARAPVTAVT